MITFITALYPEAKELIAKLNLKKQEKETLYQLFIWNCIVDCGVSDVLFVRNEGYS